VHICQRVGVRGPHNGRVQQRRSLVDHALERAKYFGVPERHRHVIRARGAGLPTRQVQRIQEAARSSPSSKRLLGVTPEWLDARVCHCANHLRGGGQGFLPRPGRAGTNARDLAR
jgi:hypothetical protein